mgnify:CR=1 FL=1
MQRIEMNVTTGERKVIDLTPQEVANAQARTAAEAIVREGERKALALAAIMEELKDADIKIIRALIEGDRQRIATHAAEQAERRAKLK